MSSGDETSTNKKPRRFPRLHIGRRLFSRRRSSKCARKSVSSLDGTSPSTSSGEHERRSTSDGTVFDTTVVEGSLSDVKTESKADNSNKNQFRECPLCLVSQPVENFPQLSICHHRSCIECLRQYLAIEISESRVNLMCPECQEKLHPADMRMILGSNLQLMDKWEEFTLRRALSVDPDCRWCPAPDCGYAVIAYNCASCPRLKCERSGCGTEFCYHCRQEWHPTQSCDSAHLQRRKQLRIRSSSVDYSQGSNFHDEIKPCPKCGALIVKMNDGSCNHMTCTVCDAEFCWLCLQEITDLHYLSPSGCTFWGKKPWSRKKKILWQLGLLIGAPLGIGLVAGIAVPAIIVGLPIWVFRRIIAQFENKEIAKYKRNMIVAACVGGSVLLSPVLATLAVGVGVPVMLLYVYGVVPFSLCRTGSYGITTRNGTGSNSALSMLPIGFRIPDNPGQSGISAPEDPASFSGGNDAINARLDPTNPSIGEASVGGITMGSFNTSHASNLDKVGRIDPDGASTIAIAGTSITGSLSGISGHLGSNRLELHSKEVDEHSTHTQISTNSNPNVISAQVHMTDNISVNSITSAPSICSSSLGGAGTGGTSLKKSLSTKSMGNKTKAKNVKRTSASLKLTSKRGIPCEEHGLPVVDDVSSSHTPSVVAMGTLDETNDVTMLQIVNECEKTKDKCSSTNKIVTCEDGTSDAGSCGSDNPLLPSSSSSSDARKLSGGSATSGNQE